MLHSTFAWFNYILIEQHFIDQMVLEFNIKSENIIVGSYTLDYLNQQLYYWFIKNTLQIRIVSSSAIHSIIHSQHSERNRDFVKHMNSVKASAHLRYCLAYG